MAQAGLLSWANSIRTTMANDPGRKIFQEQVQTHGFSFLDDYLGNILSGAKRDPLIELVKTPGRKKVISKKPQPTSKMTQVVSASSENDSGDSIKENVAPSNNLTQALLNAKKTHNNSKTESSPLSHEQGASRSQGVPNESNIPTHGSAPELSVIPEDDEGMERSRTSIQAVRSPSHDDGAGNRVPAEIPRPRSATSAPQLQPSGSESHSLQDNAPLVTASANKPKEVESPPVVDIAVPIRDVEMEPTSPLPTTRKSVLSTLPTLPEPIPLRKSMRSTKETSVGSVLLGAATPGNAAAKRTSWLMKAREAKAMDGIPKKSAANHLPIVLTGLKRKSEETVDPADYAKDEREPKVLKERKGDSAPVKAAFSGAHEAPELSLKTAEEVVERPNQDGMLDMLKKKVQGLEARNDKLSNKVSGDAAAALAEARAQAEARIAERNHQGEGGAPDVAQSADQAPPDPVSTGESERRLSVSDLFPSEGKVKDKSKAPQKPFVFGASVTKHDFSHQDTPNDQSTSTTPPNSPPAHAAVVRTSPVFNKPAPVFVPPLPNARPLPTPPAIKESSFTLPPLSGAFSKPVSIAVGIPPRFGTPPFSNKVGPAPLSSQSTMETVQSDDLFGDRGHTEAWVPSTQDTEYSSAFGSQPPGSGQPNAMDEDDSWPIDEKLSHGGHWPFGGQSKEDSMTWSTLPTQSQRADTESVSKENKNTDGGQGQVQQSKPASGMVEEDMEIEHEDFNTKVEAIPADPELEEIVLGGVKSTAVLDESEGQTSLVSSISSESQVGFFSQASKFLSSALGTSKKGKPEVKKIMQMAAVAAKKQQEEDGKKAARLKEMENRRQLAMQRKAEEEKVRQQEQERKAKEEMERRKREREEQAEKKPPKHIAASTSSKKDEEVTKKRKVEQDKLEKKAESKKPTPLNKTGFKPTSSKQTNALSSSAAFNASQSSQPIATMTAIKTSEKLSKATSAIPTKGKTKTGQKAVAQVEEDHAQPSMIIQTQMAARAKAAMQTGPRIPSENIELPEVNSEYSDSDDEGRPRTFDPPEWAQSPELRDALQVQSTINPDDIFGAIRPVRMEEMFKAKTSRFRARTSSANWSGADRLTVEEEREYAKRMGFK